GAEGTIAEGQVLDDEDGLADGGHSRHRADCAEMMVGVKCEMPGGSGILGLPEIVRPAFEHGNSANGALHWTAHPFPADWRAGVQDHTFAESFYDLPGRLHVDENRISAQHPAQRFRVRVFDLFQRP